jgi:hypothetical protein
MNSSIASLIFPQPDFLPALADCDSHFPLKPWGRPLRPRHAVRL